MKATEEQIASLRALQKIDLIDKKLREDLAQLPQRKKIAEISSKKKQLDSKRMDLQKLRSVDSKKLQRLENDIAIQDRKINEAQKKLDSAGKDFRLVDSHVKEMQSADKRKGQLEAEKSELNERINNADLMLLQIEEAEEKLDKAESEQTELFKKDAASIMAALKQLDGKRTLVASAIPEDLLAEYKELLSNKGGVAVGELASDRCGCCHSVIDPVRLLSLRKSAPLGKCPSCGRLLIIE